MAGRAGSGSQVARENRRHSGAYVEDFRGRAAGREQARRRQIRSVRALGGALVDEPLGLLVFKAENPDVAERFAQEDPYVRNGVVTSYRVREWTTVAGRDALTRVP